MRVFDWETFWINHPRQQLTIDNIKWANLRPKAYDYLKAFDEINSVLKLEKTDKILEVGCGTGEMLPILKLYMNSPKQIAGVDFSQTMVDAAKEKNPSIMIAKAPAHLLPFMDDEFDKVFMSGVIQHIAPPFFERSINEMLRVTKLGGYLFVGDVLEQAVDAAEIFSYPKKVWEQFGKVEFFESGFEKRLNVVIKKQFVGEPTSEIKKLGLWGQGDI